MYMFIYVTASDEEEAKKLARELLERKLVACVNMFPINSMYWWEGKIEEAKEVGMILKTKAEKFKEVRRTVKELHSYEVPCICAFGVDDGLKEFFEWIDSSLDLSLAEG
ncbi:MAG: divalent-cation tolerance protein CutA [Archaeoglobus sp.]|nr:divalent-cation tolerance protein CutA [Archaeoglobus sp.]